jgi:peptide/nickel transport system substrate-binding protein
MTRTMPSFGRPVALVVAVAFLVVACTSGTSSPTPGHNAVGGTVTVRLNGDFQTTNPLSKLTGLPGGQIQMALYDRLLALDANGKIIPYLAKTWTITPNGIVFTLRSDATCSDGTPVTPTVVKNSLGATVKLQPNIASRIGPGPYEFLADDAAGTVTVKLGTPWSDAIYFFAYWASDIVCPAGVSNPALLETVSAGSGPFVLQSVTHGDSVVMTARADWKWGPAGITSKSPGFPQKLIMKVVANETTAANLLLTGGLDVSLVTGPDVARLLADKSLLTKTASSFVPYPVVFNETPGRPTADDKVREALITAIDPSAWNQAAYSGHGVVTPTFITPNADCYDTNAAKLQPTPSTSTARQILLDDGYTAGSGGALQKNGKPLTINFVATTVGFNAGPEYILNQYQTIGITVNSQIVDFNTYLAHLHSSDFDVFIETAPSDTPNPGFGPRYFTGLLPPKGSNYSHVNNPPAEVEIAAGQASVGAERCTHWINAQELLLQHHDFQPLSAPESIWFSRGIDFIPGASQIQPTFLART